MPSTNPSRLREMMQPYRRYLRTGAACLVLILVAMGIWSHVVLRSTSDFSRLYQYQVEKLGRFQAAIDTLLVGDSSLGNAIDADAFSALSGSRAVNLALTGAYGYAGSLNMMRKVLRLQRPRNVIIMHTADMLTRGNDYMAYLLTAERGDFVLPARALVPAYFDYVALTFNREVLIRNLRYSFGATAVPDISERDFVPQRKPIEITPTLIERETPHAPNNPDKLYFLREIAALCGERHLNCLYVYGPLLDEICGRSRSYLESASRLIRELGLTPVAGSPICLPADAVGDTVDHVRPAFKLEYTRRYAELLTPLLK